MCCVKNRNQLVIKRARSLVLSDHGSIILQGSDLKTNPFERIENDAILISFILKDMK